MNTYTDEMYQRSGRPLAEHGYYKEREQTRQINPEPYGNWASFISNDYTQQNRDTENQFRYQVSGVKKDRSPFSAQLPYNTTPKTYTPPTHQMIPQTTRFDKVCFNEALDKAGPHYLRHWQIFDNAPFLPSNGDLSKDPRYGQQTKNFLTSYRKLQS